MAKLLEVWGDTVDSRHLSASIALGVGLATPSYLIAEQLFAGIASNAALGRSYALLVGLVGCLAAGVLSARLFRPKRVVTEQTTTDEGRQAALDEIEAETGAIGDPDELPSAVQQELRSLGLYELLADRYAQRKGPQPEWQENPA